MVIMLPLHTDEPLFEVLNKEKGVPYGAIEREAEKKRNIPDIENYIGSVRAFEFHTSQVEEDIRNAKDDGKLQELHKVELEQEKLVEDMAEAAEGVKALLDMSEEAMKNAKRSEGEKALEFKDEAFFLRTAYLTTLNRFQKSKEELQKLVGLSFTLSQSSSDKKGLEEAKKIKKEITNPPKIVSKVIASAESRGFPTKNPTKTLEENY